MEGRNMRNKILIAEDDKKISRIMELLLLHEGYETVSVYDGKEALAKIKYEKFDLVLLDVMMPIMNGIEVCRRVREFSNIPIIIVSAKGEISDKVIGLDLGANDYLTKPFANEELFIFSLGQHLFMPLNSSITMELAKVGRNRQKAWAGQFSEKYGFYFGKCIGIYRF
jgi:Response regulators consisting of a CheY-like receiver domain and a winged-helix DNA-binding domain